MVSFLIMLLSGLDPAGTDPALMPLTAAQLAAQQQKMGNEAARRKDHGGAIQALLLSYALDPVPVRLFTLGNLYRKARQPAEALLLYQRFLGEDPQSPLRKEGEAGIAAARADLGDQAVWPADVIRPHRHRGELDYRNQRYEEAMDAMALTYALAPSPRRLFNLAQACRRSGRAQMALALYQRFLSEAPRSPERPDAESQMGQILARLGVEAEARRKEEQRTRLALDGAWLPSLRFSVGFALGGRSLEFRGSAGCFLWGSSQIRMTCPTYFSTAVPGGRTEILWQPLSHLRLGWARGLGIGASLDLWPVISCGQCAEHRSSSQVRFEVGPRLSWNPLRRADRPWVLGMIQYGLNQVTVGKIVRADGRGDSRGLPDVAYHYFDLGVGTQLPLFVGRHGAVSTSAELHYHVMLHYGEIQDEASGYGPVKWGYGLRVAWTLLDVLLFRHVDLRISGQYERFAFSFAQDDPLPPGMLPPTTLAYLAAGAVDQMFGGSIMVGYQYF